MPRSSSCWRSSAAGAAAPRSAWRSAPSGRARSRPGHSTWPRYAPRATPTSGSTSSRWSSCWVYAEMADSLFLGLDVGTSAVKAILVSPAGAVTAAATAPLSLETPRPGWAEQDPEAWWQASGTAIRRVLEHRVGAGGAPVATEPSDASGTLMFDPAGLRWSGPMLDAVGLSRSLLPEVGGSSQILGRVTDQAGALTGLAPGTPVVGGGADNACGAAGVGAITPGEAVSSWGTSGTGLAPTAEPRVDPGLRAHTFCHVVPGVWYVMGVVLSAGGAFAWYRDQLARDLADTDHPEARLVEEAASVPPGAEGGAVLPYLQGERTPHRDASLRAAFVGLSLAHSRAHMTRAVLEGACFALRDCLAVLEELGLGPACLLVTGGGARSAFIRRLQADIFGLPVTTVNREEGPAYGAALLAGVGDR